MAALAAIWKAVRRAVSRELGTLGSIKLNNLFLFVLVVAYGSLNSGIVPKSAFPFLLIIGFLLLFPLSADPLDSIPAARLGLWPLTHGQRIALRLSSLALSPIVWIGLAILLTTARPLTAAALCALALVMQTAMALGRRLVDHNPHWSLLRDIPPIPGRLGGLIRKDLRQMLTLLDPYAALVFSIGGGIYRIAAPHPDPMAPTIVSLLVALTLSTSALSLFGLDSASGMTRYRLLPLRGWEVLCAKDLAHLAILAVLLLPLDPLAGLTFGLAALACGHHTSVRNEMPQHPWRFAAGRMPMGALQAVLGLSLGFMAHQQGPIVLALAALLYIASLLLYGRELE